MKLFYSYKTDVGNVRPKNEDYLFAGKIDDERDIYLFIVADGMGGHSSGEIASYKAVTSSVKAIKKSIKADTKDVLEKLERIVLQVNDLLIMEAVKINGADSPGHKGMGTTLSLLYIRDDLAYLAHVGDSRIYRYAEPELVQLTEDHSLVGKFLREGLITKEEAKTHPKRNVLYQSIGLKRKIDVQTLGPIPIRKGQKFLLCSDGLFNDIADIEIEGFFKINSTHAIADGLIRKCKRRGAADNISVIVVSTEKDDAVPLKDTVEITAPIIPPKRNRKLIVILLLLLFLLLAAISYIIIKEFSGEDSSILPARKTITNSTNLEQPEPVNPN